jgi:predicted small secreted protein
MLHRTRHLTTTLLLMAALLLASCGSDNAEGGGRDIEICSLITTVEAEAWLSGPVEPPAPNDGAGSEVTCVYESTGAQTRILLQVYDGAEFYGGDDSELHPDATPVDLGSEGYAEPGSVEFLQNDWTVNITRISGPVTDESLMAAARTVSNRLP